MKAPRLALILVSALIAAIDDVSAAPPADGFVSLFNGQNLAGWTLPAGDGGHWKVVDGAIDALAVLLKHWPEETGYDFAAHGMGQPQ